MCGRFENIAKDEELKREFEKYIGFLNIDYDLDELLKTENIAPTDNVKVITFNKDENVFNLQVMKWGIQSKIYDQARKAKGLDPYIMKPTFNSRIETCTKPGSWKVAFDTYRCLFPMTAFYEWTGPKENRVGQRISLKDNQIFFAGGLAASGEVNILSASIITCEPNSFMSVVHNRMPVIFQYANAGAYLQSKEDNSAGICVPLDEEIKMNIEVAKILAKPAPLPKAKSKPKPKQEEQADLFG